MFNWNEVTKSRASCLGMSIVVVLQWQTTGKPSLIDLLLIIESPGNMYPRRNLRDDRDAISGGVCCFDAT